MCFSYIFANYSEYVSIYMLGEILWTETAFVNLNRNLIIILQVPQAQSLRYLE